MSEENDEYEIKVISQHMDFSYKAVYTSRQADELLAFIMKLDRENRKI